MVPSCKYSRSAELPQIRLPQHVLEASLTVAVSLCHMLRVAAAVVIIMVADELFFPCPGGRLLFASSIPKFIQLYFKSDDKL